ncbi:MAG: SDR family NAD(P)-dependent oxidoreductase [Pseudomonadota bacterium]
MHFDGEVVLVTGSSRGLGHAFARYLASAGARVIVNSTGANPQADTLVEEILASGGQAHHVVCDVTQADELVTSAHAQWQRLDAIVHNAGFVRDKTLRKMTDTQWDEVQGVHLKAAFQLTRAAWPLFEAQGAGSMVLISSAAALYGNFGQSNYAAAKGGLDGLCRTIAQEGAATNIRCNTVAPVGATELNSASWDDARKAMLKTDYVAPLIAYLCHPQCQTTGGLFEASAGVFKQVRWERSAGLSLNVNAPMTLTDMHNNWSQLTDFSSSDHPADMRSALADLWAAQRRD